MVTAIRLSSSQVRFVYADTMSPYATERTSTLVVFQRASRTDLVVSLGGRTGSDVVLLVVPYLGVVAFKSVVTEG